MLAMTTLDHAEHGGAATEREHGSNCGSAVAPKHEGDHGTAAEEVAPVSEDDVDSVTEKES